MNLVSQSSIRILMVDDEPDFCESLMTLISKEGWSMNYMVDPIAVLPKLAEQPVDLVILDRRMPKMDGINLLKLLKERHPNTSVIMLSGYSDVDAIVEAMKYGATNFFTKPPNIADLVLEIERVAQKIAKQMSTIETQVVATDESMLTVHRGLIKAAPTQANILITGESGTGKELAAETLHNYSHRSEQPFIKINCAAISETLLESELFGHEIGAFTNAIKSRKGRFEQADKGSLLLDEIGDMSLHTQAKVLRIIQEKTFERVGGEKSIKVDVRIIAATNRDLEKMVKEGTFREDLFYRLSVINFHLPPLRDRRADIFPLANHFIRHFGAIYGKKILGLSESAERFFKKHRWPGNIRELKNCIERAVIFCELDYISPNDFSNQYQKFDQVSSEQIESAIEQLNKEAILTALERSGWKKQEAAKTLNINRRTLYNRMKKLGLS